MDDLKKKNKVVGFKESTRAMKNKEVRKLIIAKDAQPHIVEPLLRQAEEESIEVLRVETMKQLGRKCGISLNAAVVALIKDAVNEN
ncbi:ribosomal L7Ae/L30e/S12e/Gadd45 family protein [Isachenkonia alkalipeptolytica]|uniref:50S ribosomal protein L7ae-like protein n=1 Tax=Isachenkonia alkalipeptolytica TaxID=2565777 RepID=A0AA44BG17_9CLOT|nr:ribosomal L7Ae/L30e/S12e/Gadd45 family protein [Isachenkonia alkalipeptolytica]NBG89021.1 50S ribosomal protein L7ae-like protein [Isachenkonia alkalipeptolytica]